MGALIKLIKYIFPRVNSTDLSKMRKNIEKIFTKINSKEAEKLFKKTGEFGQSGSYGLQTKLAKRLRKLFFGIEESKNW